MNLRRFCFLACASISGLIYGACSSPIDPVVYECQILLETINKVVTEAQTITEGEQPTTDGENPNLDIWLQAADTLTQGSEAIAELKVKSPILKTYQTQISEIYSEQAQATYSMVEAWQKKNLDTALAARERTQKAGEREKTTGESLNTYCQNKEQEAQQST